MKLTRKRLNLTIDPETARKVSRISRRLGFRSPSAMGTACISAFVKMWESPQAARDEEEDEEVIRSLFAELSQWQELNGNRHDINQRI